MSIENEARFFGDEGLPTETYQAAEVTETQRMRHTLLLCEVAIGEVGAATLTPANASVLGSCYEWLQAMHTNIETALKKALEDEKN